MNAPLSRYLTRFGAESAVVASSSLALVEPMVTLTVADLEARLEAAAAIARDAAEAVHLVLRAELEQAHASTIVDAVAAARADWCDGTSGELAALIEGALATIHTNLAEATAKVLRPLLAKEARERTLAALETTVARLLADPLRPAVTVRAPADLVAALRARGLSTGVTFAVAETPEAVVTCGGTQIETRLAAALADISGT